MPNLVLLRHGESQWNLENRFTGWVDIPLSPKGEKEAILVKVGQKVMYKKWGGNEIKSNGEELVFVEQKEILAIVE